MNIKKYNKFYIFSLIGVIIAASYPIYMGLRVMGEMLQNGAVPLERYPKYVIPYTPIAITLILGVLLLPVFQRLAKKLDFLCGAVFSMELFS